MIVSFRKVLKTTLDELIRAYRKVNMHLAAARDVGALNKKETKKEHSRLWDCFCDIAEELELQSGIDRILFTELAEEIVESEFNNATLYTIMEQFGVEIADEKWWFEGVIHRNRQTGKYSIVNGRKIYTLTSGETISVRFKGESGFWVTTAFGYNKRGNGELQGCERHNIDGLPARVVLHNNEVAE